MPDLAEIPAELVPDAIRARLAVAGCYGEDACTATDACTPDQCAGALARSIPDETLAAAVAARLRTHPDDLTDREDSFVSRADALISLSWAIVCSCLPEGDPRRA